MTDTVLTIRSPLWKFSNCALKTMNFSVAGTLTSADMAAGDAPAPNKPIIW